MSVSGTSTKATGTGDGATVLFAFANKVFASSELEVYVDRVKKTITTDYSVAVASDFSSANVTFVTAPASSTAILIRRKIPRTQLVTYGTVDDFPSASHDEGLDRGVMLSQELLDPDFISSEQTVTADTKLDVVHGLGSVPQRVSVLLKCTTADLGYVVDDVVDFNAGVAIQAADGGAVVLRDATNVSIIQGATIQLLGKTSFNASAITVGSWRWLVEAWV